MNLLTKTTMTIIAALIALTGIAAPAHAADTPTYKDKAYLATRTCEQLIAEALTFLALPEGDEILCDSSKVSTSYKATATTKVRSYRADGTINAIKTTIYLNENLPQEARGVGVVVHEIAHATVFAATQEQQLAHAAALGVDMKDYRKGYYTLKPSERFAEGVSVCTGAYPYPIAIHAYDCATTEKAMAALGVNLNPEPVEITATSSTDTYTNIGERIYFNYQIKNNTNERLQLDSFRTHQVSFYGCSNYSLAPNETAQCAGMVTIHRVHANIAAAINTKLIVKAHTTSGEELTVNNNLTLTNTRALK